MYKAGKIDINLSFNLFPVPCRVSKKKNIGKKDKHLGPKHTFLSVIGENLPHNRLHPTLLIKPLLLHSMFRVHQLNQEID